MTVHDSDAVPFDSEMKQNATQKIGKYQILAELGRDVNTVSYKAHDAVTGRVVELKVINPKLADDPGTLKRLYQEAQDSVTLQHPNILSLLEMGEAAGQTYVAMEFVEGESLQNIIDHCTRLPLAAKLRLMQQLCEGIAYAHKHGFVHRDIKPANILVTKDGRVKLSGFSVPSAKGGKVLGTVLYASPEKINEGHDDSRSDIWSVACTIYEFIAYKKPFDGPNIAAIIPKILSTEPEPLSRCCPGVPAELDLLIGKGLKKNIDERYQSLEEMLDDLRPIAHSLQP